MRKYWQIMISHKNLNTLIRTFYVLCVFVVSLVFSVDDSKGFALKAGFYSSFYLQVKFNCVVLNN